MTLAVGIIIIAIIGYLISVFGFALIHTYEKYSWIMTFILMLVLFGEIGGKVDPSVPALDTGLGLAGSFLSFLAINFSSASGWCSIAADYYCNYPANTKSYKIFFLTFFGISIPTIFATVLGACLGNVAISSTAYPVLSDAYQHHGLGGLLRESYHPIGFSKFVLVLLVFSVLGNNIAVNYSSGLSLQLLGHYFHAVPRFIWSFLNALVIAILAIAGREHLSLIVSNFVSLLGYWTISFTIILLIEDQWFRRHEGYNLLVWDIPGKLPWGLAAVMALLTGYLAGGVTGMSQTWYIGMFTLTPSNFHPLPFQSFFTLHKLTKTQVPLQQNSVVSEETSESTSQRSLRSSCIHQQDGMRGRRLVAKRLRYYFQQEVPTDIVYSDEALDHRIITPLVEFKIQTSPHISETTPPCKSLLVNLAFLPQL